MKTNALNFGLLFLRLGISIGMLTHGYGKFMKILALETRLELDQRPL